MRDAAIGCRSRDRRSYRRRMPVPAPRLADSPLLVVTDVAARLVRRGLLTPADAAGRWRSARVMVFRFGPVVCDPPPGTRGMEMRCDLLPPCAR
jgi:hypothetical protein